MSFREAFQYMCNLILLLRLSSNYAPLCLSPLHFKVTLNYWFYNIPFHPLAKLANLGPIERSLSRVPSLLHSTLRLVLEVSLLPPRLPSHLCRVPWVNSVPIDVLSCAEAVLLLASDLVNRVLRLYHWPGLHALLAGCFPERIHPKHLPFHYFFHKPLPRGQPSRVGPLSGPASPDMNWPSRRSWISHYPLRFLPACLPPSL